MNYGLPEFILYAIGYAVEHEVLKNEETHIIFY